jgi:hypothetical protein
MKSLGVYLHIPFCIRKCNYCDFCSFPDRSGERMYEYTEELIRRMRIFAAEHPDYRVDTVYFGGGTPTLLPKECFGAIMSALYECFEVTDGAEISVECNPATIDREGLALLRALGINRLSIGLQSANENELKALGRRAIAWGDMFLYYHTHYNPQNKYACNAPTPEAERYMLEHLSRDVVIADWQYDPKVAPVETASVFKSAGFDCLLCPWDLGMAPMSAVMETVKSEQLTGFIHTTWHTLSTGMPYVAIAAVMGYESTPCDRRALRTATAALLRRLMPTDGNYERTGFSRHQIDFKW